MKTIDFETLRYNKPGMRAKAGRWVSEIRRKSRGREILILELSGMDSLAASVLAMQRYPESYIVPTIAVIPAEYGNRSPAVEQMRRVLIRSDGRGRLNSMIELRDIEYWSAMNGLFIPSILKCFSYYSPCPGCHVYLHSLRIALAKMLGTVRIVTGERFSHDGKQKINQTKASLLYHGKLCSSYGLKMEVPIKKISSSERVAELLTGEYDRSLDLRCIFSSAIEDGAGEKFSTHGMTLYYEHFLLPVAKEYLNQVLACWHGGKRYGDSSDTNQGPQEIAKKFLLDYAGRRSKV